MVTIMTIMNGRRGFLSIAAFASLHAAFARAQRIVEPLSGTLSISGSTTLQPVVVELARLFRERNPACRIEVSGGGTGRGMSDVLGGKADIGMVSRALKPAERGLQSYAIARDGVSFIAHRDNPVKALTRSQAHGIFTGRIANWRSVGGNDLPIRLLARGAERGSTGFITDFLEIGYDAIRAEREVGDNAEVLKAVAASPEALSYVSVGEAERAANSGMPVQLLALEGIPATAANVRSGDFPLSRPLMLVTRTVPRGLARAFIEFALSPQAAPVIIRHDFIPYAD